MKRILLLRHAEAAPSQDARQDFERPLAARGRAQAAAVAQRIVQAGLQVDLLLVSPALRTRATAEIIEAALDAAGRCGRVQFEPSLYPGTPENLWDALQQLPETVRCALLIGHNPALTALARILHVLEDDHELPTAGLRLAGFPAALHWGAMRPEQACALALSS
jgi:phosphohistidine phosphatase